MGSQAELAYYFFTHDSAYEVVAFCIEAAYMPEDESTLLGLPIVAFEQVSNLYSPQEVKMHIAVGQQAARHRLYLAAKHLGYSLANYIASRAQVWPDLLIGENVFIDEVSSIHPFVTIGNNVMLIGARVGHHSHIGDHVLLSACTLGGSVQVGNHTFIGMGTVVNEHVHIGANNIIGSGCLMNRPTTDNAIFSAPASKPRRVDATRFTLFK
ncbi:acetyltransferase [Hymenobacter seoulensis]